MSIFQHFLDIINNSCRLNRHYNYLCRFFSIFSTYIDPLSIESTLQLSMSIFSKIEFFKARNERTSAGGLPHGVSEIMHFTSSDGA